MLRRIFLALAVVIAVSAVGQNFTLHATKYHPGQGGAGTTQQLVADGAMDCLFENRDIHFNPGILDYSF